MTTLALSLFAVATAGYGDVDSGHDELNEGVTRSSQYPSLAERELHLYTNMARVEPDAFEELYNQGGCSFDDFSTDEQTPKAPLYFSQPLNEAARFHSQDMNDSGQFSHSSSDGTDFGTRVSRWYTESGQIGENIAFGYGSPSATVFNGWMCSTDGHRAAIMSGSYNELGTGVVGSYYTQDFAASTVDSPDNIAMGVHTPAIPSAGDDVTFYADYQGPGPDRLEVILTGQPYELELLYGTEEQGVWAVDLTFPDGIHHGDGCEQYYFLYTDSQGQGRFPETGSYRVGQECEDPNYGWSPWQFGVTGRDDMTEDELQGDVMITGAGCSTAPTTPRNPLAFFALVAVVLGWRRRQGP